MKNNTITNTRFSTKYLRELEERLSMKDKLILKALRDNKFMTTDQLQRLFFTTGATRAGNTRATNKALKKLRNYSLISPLKRRIGGVLCGSSASIWHLEEPGYRLLELGSGTKSPRKRFAEPSPAFLKHSLEASEYVVQSELLSRKRIIYQNTAPEELC